MVSIILRQLDLVAASATERRLFDLALREVIGKEWKDPGAAS